MELIRSTAILEWLHRATHTLPGVSAHETMGSGHHAPTLHGGEQHAGHSARKPRVLVSWQRRIGRIFGVELP